MIENYVHISGEIRRYDGGGGLVRVNVGNRVAVEVSGFHIDLGSDEVSSLVGDCVRAAVRDAGRRLLRGEPV